MSSQRKWILGSIAVVAVVVAFVAATGRFTLRDGTQGAIGAANRYQTQQMAAGDVTLKDARIQKFLQTDVFHKVATNAKFRKAITNPKFLALVKNPNLVKLAADPGFAEALNTHQELLERPDFDAMLHGSEELQQIAGSDQSVDVLQNPAFAELANDANFIELLQDPAFDELMSQAETQNADTYQELLGLAETQGKEKNVYQNIVELANNAHFVALIASNELQQAASQSELANLAELLANTNIETYLSDKHFQELLKDPAALELLTSEEMQSIAGDLVEMASQGSLDEMLSLIADPAVIEALSHAEMQEMASAELLANAVAMVQE